jgi:hypothetical protein
MCETLGLILAIIIIKGRKEGGREEGRKKGKKVGRAC